MDNLDHLNNNITFSERTKFDNYISRKSSKKNIKCAEKFKKYEIEILEILKPNNNNLEDFNIIEESLLKHFFLRSLTPELR